MNINQKVKIVNPELADFGEVGVIIEIMDEMATVNFESGHKTKYLVEDDFEEIA